MGDWKDAYGIIAEANAKKLRSSINAKTIAETEFRKQTSNSPIVAPYDGTADDPGKSFGDKVGDVGKSIGKRLIDILSVGTYAVNNTADNLLDASTKIGNGKVAEGLGEAFTAPAVGITEGLLGAFGNNDDWKKTGSDTIKKYQDDFTDTDSESKASKIGQGAGGLGIDIFADPLTYVTLGAAPLIKGAVSGSRAGSKAVAKAVEEAAEKGRAAGLTEEQIQKQILEHPNAQTYDNRLTGAVQGSKKEYAAWKESEKARKTAKAEARAFRKSGNDAEAITPELLGPNVKNELTPRPDSSFVNREAANEVQSVPAATTTTEQATRAGMDFEARRALREAGERTSTAAAKTEDQPGVIDDLIGSDIDVKGKELVLSNPNSVTAKLVESIQGSPVSVGKAEKVSGANAKLVETLGSSRAQEILDTLNKTQPKTSRYKAAQMRKLRAEYAARPSTIKQKRSLGTRAENSPPVAKEASTKPMINGREIDVLKLIEKLGAPALIPGKANWKLKNGKSIPKERLLNDLRKAVSTNDLAAVNKIAAAIHPQYFTDDILGKAAPKSVKDEVDDIIPDNPNEELFEEFDAINPNAISEQELVEKFGIRPEDAGRLLDEIEDMVDDLDLSGRITNDTIKGVSAYIQGKHISTEDMDLLKKLTGKETNNQVAAEVRAIMQSHKVEINGLKSGKKTKIQKTEEELAEQSASVAQLADTMAKSPQALDAAVGQERLLNEYKLALEKVQKSDKLLAEDKIRLAEEAVANMNLVQNKKGAKKSARGFDVNQKETAAWMRGSYGSHSGLSLHRGIIKGMVEMYKPVPMGRIPSADKARDYLDMLSIADAKARAMGIQPFQSFASGVGDTKKAINLSLYDIVREIPFETFKDMMFFKGRDYGLDITQLTGAVETFMRGKAAGLDNVKLAKDIEEWFTKPGSKAGLGDKQRVNLEKSLESRNASKNPNKRDTEAFAKSFARKLINPESTIYSNLSYRMLINSAQHASSVGKHVSDLTEPAIERILTAPTGRQFMDQLEEEISTLSKGFEPEEWELAQQMLENNIRAALNLSQNDRQMVDFASLISRATKSPAKAEQAAMAKADTLLPNGKPEHTTYGNVKTKEIPVKPKVVRSTEAKQAKMAEDEIRATAPKDAEEFSIIGASIATDMVRKMHPIKSFFVPSLGIQGDGVYRAMNTGLHTVAHLQNNFHEQLLKHMSSYGNAQLTRDFKQIQEAVVNNTGRLSVSSFESQSARDLYNVIDTMFAVSGKNVFEANAVGAEHFNALAKSAGLSESWRFNPKLSPNENAKLWSKWEGIENVPDFLSRIHNVAVRASQDISIAASFSQKFGVIGKRDGYVRIGRNSGKDDTIGMFELINRDMYYPLEVARDFGAVDKLLRESRSVSGKTAMGKFVINVMDPVTNALKASQTTVRPGHWVLSVVGDTLRNHLAGVTSITPYKQSIAVLRAGGHEMDAIGAVERYRKKATELNNAFVEGGTKGVKVNINGKFVNISNESMYRMIQNVVTLPPHSGGVMEDVLDSGTDLMKFGDLLKRGTEAVTDNKHFSLNKLASQRDNWMRTTLALDYIQKGKFKNVQEMKDGMEEYVTKWAPTSTDFTARESKYLRRSFLYYTWLRGITPRVVESMLNKPGMTTWISKSQYAVAQANGIDPQSFGNPFPEEGLYPDYYYNSVLGPQWKDDMGGEWGINPSHPSLEVLNSFGTGDPTKPVQSTLGLGAGLLGMATPFARIPLELAQGRQATGVPIEDNSQYLLDNLGGSYVSSLSRATGKTLNQNGIVDRTDSAAKNSPEEQAEHAKLQAINFLTGAQLKNYQSTEALKSAKYGIQERYRREKEEGQR